MTPMWFWLNLSASLVLSRSSVLTTPCRFPRLSCTVYGRVLRRVIGKDYKPGCVSVALGRRDLLLPNRGWMHARGASAAPRAYGAPPARSFGAGAPSRPCSPQKQEPKKGKKEEERCALRTEVKRMNPPAVHQRQSIGGSGRLTCLCRSRNRSWFFLLSKNKAGSPTPTTALISVWCDWKPRLPDFQRF